MGPAGQRFLDALRPYVPIAEAGGVPGAVMMAQAAVESRWGRSGLARVGGALFAIKARSDWAGEVYSGTTREWVPGRGRVAIPGTNRRYGSYAQAIADGCHPGSLFRAYPSFEENVRDYLRFFHENPRYHAALAAYARSRDPRQFAYDIARAGYATNPVYGPLLVAFMERYTPDLLPAAFSIRLGGRRLPPSALLVMGGRVFVHVRALAAALQWSVRYDHATKTVVVEEGRR